ECGDPSTSQSHVTMARLQLYPAGGRRLAGMDCAAVLALARLGVGIELLVERRQLPHHMRDHYFDPVNHLAAFEAIPVEAVARVWARRLHHEADRAFLRPLRRMRRMSRQQEHFALADR